MSISRSSSGLSLPASLSFQATALIVRSEPYAPFETEQGKSSATSCVVVVATAAPQAHERFAAPQRSRRGLVRADLGPHERIVELEQRIEVQRARAPERALAQRVSSA